LPNASLGQLSYSAARVPKGFPNNEGTWVVESLFTYQVNQGSPVANTYYNVGGVSLTVPTGNFALSYNGSFFIDAPNGTIGESHVSFTAASPTMISPKLSSASFIQAGGTNISKHSGEDEVSNTTQRQVFVNSWFNQSGTTQSWYAVTYNGNNYGGLRITARCAYI